jgi:hypothetical protein
MRASKPILFGFMSSYYSLRRRCCNTEGTSLAVPTQSIKPIPEIDVANNQNNTIKRQIPTLPGVAASKNGVWNASANGHGASVALSADAGWAYWRTNPGSAGCDAVVLAIAPTAPGVHWVQVEGTGQIFADIGWCRPDIVQSFVLISTGFHMRGMLINEFHTLLRLKTADVCPNFIHCGRTYSGCYHELCRPSH